MNNSQVAHIWANGIKESGKGSNFYFEGDKIFSFGAHFPVACRKILKSNGKMVIFITSKFYSPSTSRHVSLVRRAVCHLSSFILSPDLWETVENEQDLTKALAIHAEREAEAVESAKLAKREAAKRSREQKKQAEARLAPGYLNEWRAGGALPPGAYALPVALRLNGKRVETSHGAEVPARACRIAWPILAEAVATEAAFPSPAWIPFFTLPEFQWGNFTGISLRKIAAGSPVELCIGCHKIPFSEVEKIALAMSLL